MEQKKSLKNKVLRGMGKATAWTLEKGVSELALIGAIFSATNTGNYFEKVGTGIIGPVKFVYSGAKAYVTNEGFRDLTNSYALEIINGVGNIAGNIVDNPVETGIAAATTFGLYKAVPLVSKKVRKSLAEKRKQKEIK